MTTDIPPVKLNSNIVLIWSIQLVFDFLAVCSRFLSAKLNPLYSSILTAEKFKIEYLNTWHTYVMTAVEINLKCFDHRSAFNKCKWTMVSQAHNAPQLSVRLCLLCKCNVKNTKLPYYHILFRNISRGLFLNIIVQTVSHQHLHSKKNRSIFKQFHAIGFYSHLQRFVLC